MVKRKKNDRMHENQNFSSFYSQLSNIVNFPNSKVIRKILRSPPERFRPKVIALEESKDIDLMRIDKLVDFIQTYEMTIPNS